MISSRPPSRRELLLWHLAPVLPVVAVLLAMEWSPVDSAVSNWFFDAAAGVFPLRYSIALEVLGHQWPRYLVVVLACGMVAMYGLSFLLPQLEPQRRVLLFLSLGLTLAPLAVVLLKTASARHCPWSLQEYGGYAPHLGFFSLSGPASLSGHCFPGGHASGGYALFAFYFAGRVLGNRLLQHAGLWGGLAAGTAFGLVRVAQGAHFLSHNLWAAVVCWCVLAVLNAIVLDTSIPRFAGAAPRL